MSNNQIILFPGEAEKLIESLKPMLPDSIGTPEWYKQQDYIDKLNIQALLSATNQTDEFVKEYLISYQKLDILVECLICLELWKENVFYTFKENDVQLKQSFGVYTILYHEATLVNILETVLFHADAMESLQKGALDLLDYCHRRLCDLTARWDDADYKLRVFENKTGRSQKSLNDSDGSELFELQHQDEVLRFEISLKCISILHYFIDHMKLLPLAITSRLLINFDVPLLFVGLFQKAPWVMEMPDGTLYKFIDNKWVQQNNWLQLRNNMSKLEGQVWLGLYQLLLSDECRDKYDLNGYRKSILLNIRHHLTDVTIDKLPVLVDLRKFLDQLSISDVGNPKPNLVLEQIAEFRDVILTDYEKKWPLVRKSFVSFLKSSEYQECLKKQASAWSETYNFDNIDNLISDIPKCALCGEEAAKRCSRCKSEWYCRRECQVEHWKKHKVACDLISGSNK